MTAFEIQQEKTIAALQLAFNACVTLHAYTKWHGIPNHKNYKTSAAVDYVISASAAVREADSSLYPLSYNDLIDKRTEEGARDMVGRTTYKKD